MRKTGIHRTAVSQIERGLTDPELETIYRLAAGLGVTATELINEASIKSS